MEGFYRGLFRKARDEIGAKSFGLAVIELEPNADNHPDHDHPDQEEVYVVLRGSGELLVAGEAVPLDPETIVRVARTPAARSTPATTECVCLRSAACRARPTRRRVTRT